MVLKVPVSNKIACAYISTRLRRTGKWKGGDYIQNQRRTPTTSTIANLDGLYVAVPRHQSNQRACHIMKRSRPSIYKQGILTIHLNYIKHFGLYFSFKIYCQIKGWQDNGDKVTVAFNRMEQWCKSTLL